MLFRPREIPELLSFILLFQCLEAVSVNIFLGFLFSLPLSLSLAEEQYFSLDSAFLIVDILWYGEGLVRALAF